MPKVRIIKFISAIAVALFATYLLFIQAMVTDGFRDYPKYCEGYFPYLESIRKESGSYPSSLDMIQSIKPSFRYEPKGCSYSSTETSFEMITSYGLIGVAIYTSKEGAWYYD